MPSSTPNSGPSPAVETAPTDLLALLRGVSRSFYLSIRLLPAGMRQPIAAAYLLARASDTIADTTDIAATDRAQMLDQLCGLFDGTAAPHVPREILARFAPAQHDADERALMESLPRCLALKAQLSAADQSDVDEVLRHITRGQRLDVERFGTARDGALFAALQNAAELDEYTWLVAGCVGEFWTNIGFRHMPGFATLHESEMKTLGRSYGKGLQLVNILRDLGDDLAAGRCYLPADELAQLGVRPEDIRAQPGAISPIWSGLLDKARRHLDDGMRYADALTSRRIRAASALPALLGTRTLSLLTTAGPAAAMQHRIKMPRAEVRAVLMHTALTLASRASLHSQYKKLSPGGWDNPRQ